MIDWHDVANFASVFVGEFVGLAAVAAKRALNVDLVFFVAKLLFRPNFKHLRPRVLVRCWRQHLRVVAALVASHRVHFANHSNRHHWQAL